MPRPRNGYEKGSNFQKFFKLREVARAVAGDECHVLQSDSTQFGVIKPRLDCHHVAGTQRVLGMRRETRGFMDFQTDAMARAVKKSLHTPFGAAGFVAFIRKKLLHFLMHVPSPRFTPEV